MAWQENYRRGSFRGAEFNVETTEDSHGRRQVTHEYPSLDKPYTEDLGRRYDEFTVEGYVIGPDYQIARDALIKACRDEIGPGILVHPYRGELSVTCRGLRVRESSKEGGMAIVTMTFIESGETFYPTTVTDTISAVDAAGDKLTDAAMNGLLDTYTVDGFPAFVRDASAVQLQEFAAFFDSPALGKIQSGIDLATSFTRDLARLTDDAFSIASNPLQLFASVSGIIQSARLLYGSASGVLARLFDVFGGEYTGSSETLSRRQQHYNTIAVQQLIRQVAIAEAAKAVVRDDQPSYEDAIKARELVTERLDDEMEAAFSDDAFLALQQLRGEIVKAVPSQDEQLPRLLSYTPPATQPALLVSYSLYADAARDAEIVARNGIRHPGFVSGGQALEVLGNA